MNTRERKTWKWRNLLTEKELRHLKESGLKSMEDLRRHAEFVKEELEKRREGKPFLVCWQCVDVLRKLELL